eukprot:5310411-Pyramimonas_sp.AAC.1
MPPPSRKVAKSAMAMVLSKRSAGRKEKVLTAPAAAVAGGVPTMAEVVTLSAAGCTTTLASAPATAMGVRSTAADSAYVPATAAAYWNLATPLASKTPATGWRALVAAPPPVT